MTEKSSGGLLVSALANPSGIRHLGFSERELGRPRFVK
jgi:hypothetical protein